MKNPKFDFENEITGSYHTERKTDPVLVAVGIIIVACGIIYLLAF